MLLSHAICLKLIIAGNSIWKTVWLVLASLYLVSLSILFFSHLLYSTKRFMLPLCFSSDGATLESVPDLVKAMYVNIESFPCVRLLNLSGEISCSSEYLGLPLRGDWNCVSSKETVIPRKKLWARLVSRNWPRNRRIHLAILALCYLVATELHRHIIGQNLKQNNTLHLLQKFCYAFSYALDVADESSSCELVARMHYHLF
jgi:hypothetical protein